MRRLLVAVSVMVAVTVAADDLQRAQELAWAKQFAASEALYRAILEQQPQSRDARLGLARVVLWQGRYAEAIALFDQLDGADAIEGRATALYWSGDLRGAAREFRRVLELDPGRELARKSLAEIVAVARPSQRVTVRGSTDDQPLDHIRSEVAATFFSDAQTKWTATVGRYDAEAERLARSASGGYVRVENETTFRGITAGGSLGMFTWPDGKRGVIGSALLRRRTLSLRVERRPELASAPSLRTHAASTMTAFRWDYDRNAIAAAEVSHVRYSDDNEGRAAIAYAVVPLRRNGWRFWSGASAAARDTDEQRFGVTAISSTLDGPSFRYRYRGEYDPYWTPDDLLEVRAVFAAERRLPRGTIKLHADAGYARDRARAFGPDTGPAPFPASTFPIAFNRTSHPWRAGLTANFDVSSAYGIEAGVERSTTVDYRVTSFHASLVRRR